MSYTAYVDHRRRIAREALTPWATANGVRLTDAMVDAVARHGRLPTDRPERYEVDASVREGADSRTMAPVTTAEVRETETAVTEAGIVTVEYVSSAGRVTATDGRKVTMAVRAGRAHDRWQAALETALSRLIGDPATAVRTPLLWVGRGRTVVSGHRYTDIDAGVGDARARNVVRVEDRHVADTAWQTPSAWLPRVGRRGSDERPGGRGLRADRSRPAMTAAERVALHRWKKSRQGKYSCPDHGDLLRDCSTLCRQRELGIGTHATTDATTALAASAASGTGLGERD